MRDGRVLAVATVLALALAGCGGGDGGDGDGGGEGGRDTAAGDSIFTEQPTPVAAPAETTPAAPPAGTTPPAAPAPIDACALLTQAEADALAGTPLDPPVASEASCTWAGPVTGPTAQVEIYTGDGAKKILDIDRQLNHVFTEIPGLGEEAWAEDGMVFALVDGTWIGVRLVLLSDPAEYGPRLEEAARIAAGRL